MLRLNLDQKTLAEKSNISPSALGHYLSDKTECRVSALDKVLKPLKWDSIGDIFKAATDKKRRHQRTRRLKKLAASKLTANTHRSRDVASNSWRRHSSVEMGQSRSVINHPRRSAEMSYDTVRRAKRQRRAPRRRNPQGPA